MGASLRCGVGASRCSVISCCGAQAVDRASLPSGTWDFPESGIEFVCPALAGMFLTRGPPDKSFFVSILLEGLYCCVGFRYTVK